VARKTLTDNMVGKLKPGPKRVTLPDPEMRGHYIRITPNGAKSYVAVAREAAGKRRQVWATIGSADHFPIDEARERAREAIKRIKEGKTPFEPLPAKPDSFGEVAESYLKRHVKARRLRSQAEIARILERYILPAWRDREFTDIRRGDVTTLLDLVQDANGPRQADYVLAVIRGIMNWYASRTDDYQPPLARGMGRVDAKNRKRARVLDDDELRAVWKAAENSGTFGAIIRLALLTAQRREKIASMEWCHVTVDGVWEIPAKEREKGSGGVLVLPDAALQVIQAQMRVGDNPYVFSGRRGGHFSGWSPCKRSLDARLPEVAPWRIHDLRRTARSLMARAGVRPDVAERVMGHAIQGVEGVYDRHQYRDEKADALRKLAGLIERIVNPVENVVALETAL
jgi:integrase